MGIKPKFTKAEIRSTFVQRRDRIEQAILATLMYLGEMCVNHARSVNTYQDQTGNLRNSIGYIIVKNGRTIASSFVKSVTGTVESDEDGVKIGRGLARELAKQHNTGYALIVVAGMNYAAAVESKGFDVLSSAEHLAEKEFPRMIRDLKLQIAA
ncbi:MULTISPECIES: hypothetical protein [Siphonobacter]|uniref:Uncharacterized protein n=1 Tax=Siphonobacter curvatus TaxID=2094562 RepID=A0A2S7IR60_9BACT|nr:MULTISPECIES: hypothetical protein [Siphonobacter]MDQ1088564.1 hypothetical protein [Siphonobacter sp. SORGH_AS_1065]PQA60194.1 hypothetical protein C5O19_11405 [Siphonobacter curvatus]